MNGPQLPSRPEMLEAFLARNESYEGIFVTAVKTTGIFCRPTCPARKPKPANVEFYGTSKEALFAGYRPCLRCRPLRPAGEPPQWLEPVLAAVEEEPSRRWRDRDLRALGLSPERVRRWFQREHGMTFHAYSRARRLGEALGHIQRGQPVTRSAFGAGFDSLSGFNEAFRKMSGSAPSVSRAAPLLAVTRLQTPLGPMVAVADDAALLLLEFADRRALPTQMRRLQQLTGAIFKPGSNGTLAALSRELEAYFAGDAAGFTVALHTPGTPFQRQVWEALAEIPRGTTTSYGAIATRIGRPTAVRAVARANGANRIAILVPCHRVIGADGALTGYGGGLWRKRRLLALEAGGEP